MTEITLFVPDIGDFDDVEIIEILVNEGDSVAVEDSLVTLETDKATMDIPASDAGTITSLLVKVGDRINKGDAVAKIELSDSPKPQATAEEQIPSAPTETPEAEEAPKPASAAPAKPAPATPRPSPTANIDEVSFSQAHASPSIRKFARELGVGLGQITGSGRKGRITQEDVKGFIKQAMTSGGGAGGLQVAPMPEIDFTGSISHTLPSSMRPILLSSRSFVNPWCLNTRNRA
jgi:pyruvate dehydrogenase E2 component (dihydrolipoamide acetyltransferase)